MCTGIHCNTFSKKTKINPYVSIVFEFYNSINKDNVPTLIGKISNDILLFVIHTDIERNISAVSY